jgi:hypothetical protein
MPEHTTRPTTYRITASDIPDTTTTDSVPASAEFPNV